MFDDDNDYFKINEKNQSENKLKLVVALDFATRKVIESSAEDMKIKTKLHNDIKKHLENVDSMYKKLQKQSKLTNSLLVCQINTKKNMYINHNFPEHQ